MPKSFMKKGEEKITIPFFKENFFLYGEISDESVSNLIKEIKEYENKVISVFSVYNVKLISKLEPVALHINSKGGDVMAGFALMDYIENSKLNFVTIAEGCVMSMALPIYLTGSKRYSGNFATFHFHESSILEYGYLTKIKESVEENERLDNIIDDYIVERTKISKNKLKKIKMNQQDWYINKEEAIKLGIVTD